MKKNSFHSVLRKLESGDVTVRELISLFHPLLRHGLPADRQLAVCRTLAHVQHAYAADADPRLEGWITDVTKALQGAGAEARVVQAIADKLAAGTYLCDAQYAHVPEHEPPSLTVSLYFIFFDQRPQVRTASQSESTLVRVYLVVRANLGLLAGGAITVALIAGMLWLFQGNGESNQSICPRNGISVHGDRPIFFQDGSKAILEPGAEVCYNGLREVGLIRGTVTFEIEPDAVHPFRIRTPGDVQCLIFGTGLTVSYNAELQTCDVAVKHGIVVVKFNGQTLDIPPGQRISIDLLSKQMTFTRFDPTKSDLNLQRVPLKTLAKALEDRMHINVRFENVDFKEIPVYAHYQNGDMRVRHIVSHLNLVLSQSGIEAKLTGRTLLIRKRH